MRTNDTTCNCGEQKLSDIEKYIAQSPMAIVGRSPFGMSHFHYLRESPEGDKLFLQIIRNDRNEIFASRFLTVSAAGVVQRLPGAGCDCN